MATDNPHSEILFSVVGLSLRIGGRLLIQGLDLQLRRGRCVGLAGPSGLGKTTLLRSVLSGQWPEGSAWQALQPLEDPALYSAQTFNLPADVGVDSLLDSFAPAHQWQPVLRELELESAIRQRVGLLSGGERQRLALVIAIVSDVPICCFDEPVTGLDADLKQRALVALSKALERRAAAAFIISHDPFTLGLLCDDVIVLGERPARVTFGTPHPRTIEDLASGRDAAVFSKLSESMFAPARAPTGPPS
jgi:ABC-type multidrug transport system ATPase subunit